MGLTARKRVFGVSNKASFKPVSSATEFSLKIEISPVTGLHKVNNKGAGWSAHVLFATPEDRFSRVQTNIIPSKRLH